MEATGHYLIVVVPAETHFDKTSWLWLCGPRQQMMGQHWEGQKRTAQATTRAWNLSGSFFLSFGAGRARVNAKEAAEAAAAWARVLQGGKGMGGADEVNEVELA
ncbi:hypothetical protein FRC08_008906 [Ceratobasidium sp. 394]|nr:hypothetical protein FRC08_008906 [Ceratobasidium sp. 394]